MRAWRAVSACERARICDRSERGAVVENRCVDSPRQTRLPVRFAQRSCPSSMTSSRARERPPERDARFLCVDSNDAACKRKKYISLHLPPTFVVVRSSSTEISGSSQTIAAFLTLIACIIGLNFFSVRCPIGFKLCERTALIPSSSKTSRASGVRLFLSTLTTHSRVRLTAVQCTCVAGSPWRFWRLDFVWSPDSMTWDTIQPTRWRRVRTQRCDTREKP